MKKVTEVFRSIPAPVVTPPGSEHLRCTLPTPRNDASKAPPIMPLWPNMCRPQQSLTSVAMAPPTEQALLVPRPMFPRTRLLQWLGSAVPTPFRQFSTVPAKEQVRLFYRVENEKSRWKPPQETEPT